jgi:hypothetical protein
MKHALIAVALLMSHVAAHAAEGTQRQSVNYNDPAFSKSKTCWRRHSSDAQMAQPRLIHADAQVSPEEKLRARQRSMSVI